MALEPTQARHGLTVLTRLAQRSPTGRRELARLLASDVDALAVPAIEVAAETGEPMVGLLIELLETNPVSLETLLALRSRAPDGELGLLVDEQLADRILRGEPVEPRQAAAVLVGLANRLVDADGADAALPVATRAVTMARDLPAKFDDPVLLRALAALARGQTATKDHESASRTITEAVALAERRFGGLAEPYLGTLLQAQATQLRLAGRVRDALAAYTRAAQVWQEVHRAPDLDPGLVMSRAMSDSPTGREPIVFNPDGSVETVPSIHIAVGGPTPALYEGPVFGSYRFNAVLAEDGEFYVGPRNWSPRAARLTYGRVRRERGRTLLLLGEPGAALPELRAGVELLGPLGDSELTEHRAELAVAELAYAIGLWWHDHVDDAVELAVRAGDRFADLDDLDPAELAGHACHTVVGGIGGDRWLDYFTQLVGLGRALAPTDDGRLLGALHHALHELALSLKTEKRTAAAIPMLRLVVDTTDDPTQRVMSLVGLANAHLREDDHAVAITTAELAVAAASTLSRPQLLASACHALARCLGAAGRSAAAVDAEERAVSTFLPLLAEDHSHAVPVVDMLHGFLLALGRDQRPVRLTPPMHAAVVDLLGTPSTLPDRSVASLAELGFVLASQVARERSLSGTRRVYESFLRFAHRYGASDEPRTARAMLGWNVTMCFVDCLDWASARLAVDDVAALVASSPGNDLFVVEHAKSASELLAALWNSGAYEEARGVVREAEGSFRSSAYLMARERDIGEAPEQFLATLDAILGSG